MAHAPNCVYLNVESSYEILKVYFGHLMAINFYPSPLERRKYVRKMFCEVQVLSSFTNSKALYRQSLQMNESKGPMSQLMDKCLFVLLFQNWSLCKPFHMKMSLIDMKMNLQVTVL